MQKSFQVVFKFLKPVIGLGLKSFKPLFFLTVCFIKLKLYSRKALQWRNTYPPDNVEISGSSYRRIRYTISKHQWADRSELKQALQRFCELLSKQLGTSFNCQYIGSANNICLANACLELSIFIFHLPQFIKLSALSLSSIFLHFFITLFSFQLSFNFLSALSRLSLSIQFSVRQTKPKHFRLVVFK